jgi:octopine/nopaline transport system permease protein
MDFAFLKSTLLLLMGGVPLTLKLVFIAICLGGVLATCLALMRLSDSKVLNICAKGYLLVIRGTPLLVQIFLIYYGLGQFRPTLQELGLWSFFREPFWCAVLALSLNTAAYGSEVIRGGILSVPQQQVEAARAYGMSGVLLAWRIVTPIALRQALPAYCNEITLMVKATSLTSIITMMEVTGLAAKLISESYRVVEVFIVAGGIYLALNLCITQCVALLEWWVSPHLRKPSSPEMPR